MKEGNKEIISPFKVFIRIRPLLERELKQLSALNIDIPNKQFEKTTLSVEKNTIYLKDPFNTEFYGKNTKAFSFDNVFTEKDQNKDIFDSIIKKLIDNILQGYNSTALAYGITGTGKTHTMFGDIYQNLNFEKGICMYSVDYLFDKITSEKNIAFFTKMSYLEIYNEQVIDLLTEKPSNEGIMIVEDPKKGVIVPELTQKIVSTSEEVLSYIILGNQRRTMGPTGQNQFSSRSHAILEITVEQRITNNDNKEELINSKISFVDLAGSERGGLEKGIRREEGSNINKSLLALGNCINILSDKTKKGSFVPYRDSKLTRLLKDSLGGNIVTLMIACVSPSPMSYEETYSTLNYASRANKIEKKITRNIKEVDQYTAQYRDIIVSLRAEISQLRDIIRNQHLLLQLKPNDSFRDEINCNFANDNENPIRNHERSIIYEDFFNPDEIEKLEYNRIIDEIISSNNNIIEKNEPIMLHCNYEVYENFLKSNLNNLTEEEFEDFENKMEALYFDKVKLEDKIKRGMKDSEINEKYTIIRTFYEKFIELINDKLIENIEQNMILKFNLKEILELNEGNCKNLIATEEQLKSTNTFEVKVKLEEELLNYQKNICNNEKEKYTIQSSLDQNMKIKSLLKKLLFKFISNTQMKEIKELQQNYTSLLNEKRELEIKNKKYQEYLSSVIKEKDEKSAKIAEMSSELEKMKKQLNMKDKRVRELEKQMNNTEYSTENIRYPNKRRINTISLEPIQKTSIRKLIKYFDDCDIKSYFPKNLKKERRSISRSKRVSRRTVTNNFISINLNQKIPTITAFIQGGDIFTNEYKTKAASKDINTLKTNLIKKKSIKIKTSTNDFVDNNNNVKPIGSILNKNESIHNLSSFLHNSSFMVNGDRDDELKGNNSILNLANDLKGNNFPILTHSNSKQFHAPNKQKKLNKRERSKKSNMDINYDMDNISLSAVTANYEAIINSSALDMMNNVLSLEGIKGEFEKKKYT